MNEQISIDQNDDVLEPLLAKVHSPNEVSAPERSLPERQLVQDHEEETDSLAEVIDDEAVQVLGEDETEEDYEREIEFGFMEVLREEHFQMLEHNDNQKPKYPPFEHLVDGLLPVHEVHVIAGETGAGKSTWLFDNFINPWQHEEPVLGRKSHWFPYVIFVNDRTKSGMIRMLQRLKLNPKQFPIESTITASKLTLVEKIEAFHKVNPALKVVFIEGLHVGQKDGNDYGESSQVM